MTTRLRPRSRARLLATDADTPRLLVLLLAVFAVGLPSARVAADDGSRAVRWWEDPAVAPPPAENVARFAVLSEISDDQFAAWLTAFDAHQLAIDALVAEAAASGPVVYQLDDDEVTGVRRQIDVMERRGRLRRGMESRRDQLFAALLESLTEPQRDRAVAWRNLILLDADLIERPLAGSGSIPFAALDETLAELAVDRGEVIPIGALLSATADSRRAIAVELGVRDGGFDALVLRRAAAAMDAGAAWTEAYRGVSAEIDPELRDRLRPMDRYRTLVLGAIEDLGGLGLSRSVADEARARILARCDPNLGSPGSVIAGAARLMETELTDETRAELERLNDAALRALIEHARTRPSRFESRAEPRTPAMEETWRARLAATRAAVAELSPRVRELGGSFPSVGSSMSMIVRPDQMPGAEGAGGVITGGAATAVAVALAPNIGWTEEDARRRAEEIADGRPVREVGDVPDTEQATRAADLLQVVADAERLVAALTESRRERSGRRLDAVPPDDRWGNTPLTAWILAAATERERTPERLRRLLEFERTRLAGLEAVRAAELAAAAEVDWEDQAEISQRITAIWQQAAERGALATAALADVTRDSPRLHAAVCDAIDRRRIGWMLARHRSLEALLAEVQVELRLDPVRRLALVEAGGALRAVARRADLWLGEPSDPGGMTPGDNSVVIEYRAANRQWSRHAFAAEVIQLRQQLLAR